MGVITFQFENTGETAVVAQHKANIGVRLMLAVLYKL